MDIGTVSSHAELALKMLTMEFDATLKFISAINNSAKTGRIKKLIEDIDRALGGDNPISLELEGDELNLHLNLGFYDGREQQELIIKAMKKNHLKIVGVWSYYSGAQFSPPKTWKADGVKIRTVWVRD